MINNLNKLLKEIWISIILKLIDQIQYCLAHFSSQGSVGYMQRSFEKLPGFPRNLTARRAFGMKCSKNISLESCLAWYSVSSLETTIFREIISLVRVNFRRTFLSSWLTPNFYTLMGGNTCPLLPPIRVEKYGVSQELRKVDLKNWLVWQKIVVSKLETLYVNAMLRFSTLWTGTWFNVIYKILTTSRNFCM